jgi:hypothetical protein
MLAKDREILRQIDFEFGEAALLCDGLRALWLSPNFIEKLWAEMARVIRTEHLEHKWATSARALAARVARCDRESATALLRAAILFWERPKSRLPSSCRSSD